MPEETPLTTFSIPAPAGLPSSLPSPQSRQASRPQPGSPTGLPGPLRAPRIVTT